MTINLVKTKAMIFKESNTILTDFNFFFQGEEVEITTTYTYLGIHFSRYRFGLKKVLQPQIKKRYGSIALLEWQCFQNHFQNISSKMDLMDFIIR
jgi:hypothetical protein